MENPTQHIDRQLLGNKAAGLCTMERLGIPVPPYAVLTTQAWKQYDASRAIETLNPEIQEAIKHLEELTRSRLGDSENPLFFSVRSGSVCSLPGAMETILNVGLTEKTLPALSRLIGDKPAQDAYDLLLESIATTAFGISKEVIQKEKTKGHLQNIFTSQQWNEIQNPQTQMRLCIASVFESWDGSAAIEARAARGIDRGLGTAVTLQAMIFGNSQETNSGSGVMFSRNPRKWSDSPVVVYKQHCQGNLVVGNGNRDAYTPIDRMNLPKTQQDQLLIIAQKLETELGWPQEIEFTVQGGELAFLQTRGVVLAPVAHLRQICYLQSHNKLPLPMDLYLPPNILHSLRSFTFEKNNLKKQEAAAKDGIVIVPGCAVGTLVRATKEAKDPKKPYILAPGSMTIEEMEKALQNPHIVGIITQNAGAASHLGRVAAGGTTPCVFGVLIREELVGKVVSLDANEGVVYEGKIPRGRRRDGDGLTHEEKKMVAQAYRRWKHNPWGPYADKKQAERHRRTMRAAFLASQFQSPKAREALLRELFPKEIMFVYVPYRTQDHNHHEVNAFIENCLLMGFDATIRGCPTEQDGRAKAPYMIFRHNPNDPTNEQLHRFWKDFPSWDTPEVLLGQIPKGKLDGDLREEHCSLTVSVSPNGQICFQTHLGPQLRNHDTDITSSFVTMWATQTTHGLDITTTTVGGAIPCDSALPQVAGVLVDRVCGWWSRYDLPSSMSGAMEALREQEKRENSCYLPITLEIQARFDPNTKNLVWASIYGLKVDKKL